MESLRKDANPRIERNQPDERAQTWQRMNEDAEEQEKKTSEPKLPLTNPTLGRKEKRAPIHRQILQCSRI
jgi:hypothetical protein